MNDTKLLFKSGNQLSSRSVLLWRIAQAIVWLVGVVILYCLLFMPSLGVVLFWNILIPVAPALFVLVIGIWRNVCPLATTHLLPRHLGLSKRKKISAVQLGKLNLIAVIALFAIVPLRHALFNNNGIATGIMIIAMGVIAFILGLFYEWKSAWCSGLCPIHPVERLYGGNVLVSVPNAHCNKCMNCVIPCPDSTPNMNPRTASKTIYHKLSGLLIVGGLPGFIWGWFHVPDEPKLPSSFDSILTVYELPVLCFLLTLSLYGIIALFITAKQEKRLIQIFATAGVSCYYWYRIPSLFGFGNFTDDGLLVNLRNILPEWTLPVITICTTVFFIYFLVIRNQNKQSWVIRPQYAEVN